MRIIKTAILMAAVFAVLPLSSVYAHSSVSSSQSISFEGYTTSGCGACTKTIPGWSVAQNTDAAGAASRRITTLNDMLVFNQSQGKFINNYNESITISKRPSKAASINNMSFFNQHNVEVTNNINKVIELRRKR
jgi:hypothetical protein